MHQHNLGIFEPVPEPDQIAIANYLDVERANQRAHVLEPVMAVQVLVVFSEVSLHCYLRNHEHHQDQRPKQYLYCVVVPERNEEDDAE